MTIKKILFLLLATIPPMMASAYDAQIDGIYYNFNKTEKIATVTYRSSESSYKQYDYSGAVNIPATVVYSGETYSVTSIEDEAFYDCSGLTFIMIPSSVSNIGSNAFSGCTTLMTVKSYINEPFNVTRLFATETYRQGTLYVPKGTKDLYIRFDGWREFLKIEEMEQEPAPNGECAMPTIIVMGNKFKFQCETPGAAFTSTLTMEKQFTGDEVVMDTDEVTYLLTVYANAPGYDQSRPAKYRFTVSKSDVNQDGKVDVTDIATLISAMAGKSGKGRAE